MQLATWNVNSLKVRLGHVQDWLRSNPVDVLCLQELKLTDENFPITELAALGYTSHFTGQKTYNGVALVTRVPTTDVICNIPGHDDAQARLITGTLGDIRVIGAYVVNGQAVDSPKFGYKMGWLEALRAFVAQEIKKHPKLVLMGDFNIAPDDRDVHDPALWAGQVLCTPQERAHFADLLSLGLHDSFRLFEQPPKIYSWWDYRQLGFQKNRGLRIDHILVSDALKPLVRSSIVDKPTRKNERPSDHAPVIAELDMTAPGT